MNPPRCTTRRRLNAVSIAKLIKAMQEEAVTVHELVEVTGLCLFTVRHYVLTMHREQVCHIKHWEQDSRGRFTTPAYTLGAGKDAKKPKVSESERAKKYRARQKQAAFLQAMVA